MRDLTRTSTAAGTIAVTAALTTALLGNGIADAAGDKVLHVSTPAANTVVLKIANHNVNNGINCGVYGAGPTTFSASATIAPRNSKTVTVADVPSGNYTISWGCNSFAQEKHYVTVRGTSAPKARPHVVPNNSIPAAPAPVSPNGSLVISVVDMLIGALRSYGS